MNRRGFLDVAGRAAAGAILLSPPRRQGPFRGWAWVHGGGETSADAWRRRFARVRDAGITGVLVSGGDTELLAAAAHAAGLEFHRWIWVLNRSGDAGAKTQHPEWFTVSRKGESSLVHPPYVNYYQWVCPTRAPVREYLRGLVDQVARHPGVDGVHLDYIRYPDVILPVGLWSKYGLVQDHELAEFDFCYCDVCRPTFQALSGSDPLDLPDPASDEAWRAFRWNSVTRLVRELAEVVHGRGKPLSAAVFPTPALARRLVRQAWEQWPLDAVFPMLYHTFYEEPVSWIARATQEGIEALGERDAPPLHSGLYLPSLSPRELEDAVRAARGGGAAGVCLFELGGLSDGHLARLRPALRG